MSGVLLVYQYHVVAVVLADTDLNPTSFHSFQFFTGFTLSQSHILFHFWGIMPYSVIFALFRKINSFSSMNVGHQVSNTGFWYTAAASLMLAYHVWNIVVIR